ncbi:DinG family ATP-dependent helicase YoaA [hydrothermal vent metagenome]|uniref:DNA 5'-3' helicase n=1 Tax=hydrothermal vent metagenome TaxID=652676 RepID=A0A3B0YGF0_9ZZZZ
MVSKAYDILANDGPFSQYVSGFSARSSQQEMAQLIQDTLQGTKGDNRQAVNEKNEENEQTSQHSIIVEAGTGIGKTFAYLVPSILSARKVIVSTGTRNLQDQLFHRDLPLVKKALNSSIKTALLKGRRNYLCIYRLQSARKDVRHSHPFVVDELEQIEAWSGRTRSGDVIELDQIPESSVVWPMVTSTVENCLGQDCPDVKECHVLKARRRAQQADILVINHHLLFADMLLKDNGFGELLPGAEAIILDEAHQLPDLAIQMFGTALSHRQLIELLKDVEAEAIKVFGKSEELTREVTPVKKAIQHFKSEVSGLKGRQIWQELIVKSAVKKTFNALSAAVNELQNYLSDIAAESRGLENCQKRCDQILKRFDLMSEKNESDYACWLEISSSGFIWYLTPVDIAHKFKAKIDRYDAAWVMTSATLAVESKFKHFIERMGMTPEQTAQFDSPFDYQKNALLYLPQAMPEPSHPDYTRAVVDSSIDIINQCPGGVFFLFTSYRALNLAHEMLKRRCNKPLLVQGSAPRNDLLDDFRVHGRSVLLGTSSFWEGVDVRGQSLSCVIIDKLPFASPGDPVLQARIDLAKRQGKNPFMELQLPQAVINLKQGVGRLIRDVSDKGVMMLCDPRLKSKPYGKIFLKSLPPMRHTTEAEDVDKFFDFMLEEV